MGEIRFDYKSNADKVGMDVNKLTTQLTNLGKRVDDLKNYAQKTAIQIDYLRAKGASNAEIMAVLSKRILASASAAERLQIPLPQNVAELARLAQQGQRASLSLSSLADNVAHGDMSLRGLVTSLGGANVGLLALGAGALGIGKFIKDATTDTADLGSELYELNQRTKVSVETLSVWRYGAALSNVSTEELATALKHLNVALAGNKPVFAEMGLDPRKLKTTEEALLAISKVFTETADSNQQVAWSMELFSRAGDKMIPFLLEGPDRLRELADEARNVGIVFDQEAAKAADEFGDKLTTLGFIWEGFKRKLGEAVYRSPSREGPHDWRQFGAMNRGGTPPPGPIPEPPMPAAPGLPDTSLNAYWRLMQYGEQSPGGGFIQPYKKPQPAAPGWYPNLDPLKAWREDQQRQQARVLSFLPRPNLNVPSASLPGPLAGLIDFDKIKNAAAANIKGPDRGEQIQFDLDQMLGTEERRQAAAEEFREISRALKAVQEEGAAAAGGLEGIISPDTLDQIEDAAKRFENFQARMQAVGEGIAGAVTMMADGIRGGGVALAAALMKMTGMAMIRWGAHMMKQGAAEIAMGSAPPPFGPNPALLAHGAMLMSTGGTYGAIGAGLTAAGTITGAVAGAVGQGGERGSTFNPVQTSPQAPGRIDIGGISAGQGASGGSNPNSLPQQLNRLNNNLERLSSIPRDSVLTTDRYGEIRQQVLDVSAA